MLTHANATKKKKERMVEVKNNSVPILRIITYQPPMSTKGAVMCKNSRSLDNNHTYLAMCYYVYC